jgi:enoyl-CoA hydratase/carnithine racemase
VPVVEVTRDNEVCWLRLNRPDKLNALDWDTHDELRAALADFAEQPEVRILVLAGNGRAFSAGADLTSRTQNEPGRDWSRQRHDAGRWQRLLDLLESVPQVTVASLHGHCIGGAALLALACDLRIAADDLQVRIPELAIGIPLTWAGIPRLAREVGLPLARDLVMTGRVLGAPEALRAGFVQRVAPAGELGDATRGLVEELRAMPAGPLAMTRSAFSALNRERLGASPWADADLLRWSTQERTTRALTADVQEPVRPGAGPSARKDG